MGSFSFAHWAIVLVVVLIVFGAGRLPKTMGDLAKGVRAFKSGLKDDEVEAGADPMIEAKPGEPVRRA